MGLSFHCKLVDQRRISTILVGILTIGFFEAVQLSAEPSVPLAADVNDAAIAIIKEEVVVGGPAICKWSNKEMDIETFKEEYDELLKYNVTNMLYFEGAPFALFAVNEHGKVIHKWRVCVKGEKLPGVTPVKISEPYLEDNIPNLVGLAMTCPSQHPGPAQCKSALAVALKNRGLEPIGNVRITNIPPNSDHPTSHKYWVPYRVLD